MHPRRALTATGLLVALYVCCVVGIYAWHFRAQPIASADPGAWGQFGDYLGGLLNPVLALLNVCVIVYLALAVQRLNESKREDREESKLRIQTVIELHREWNGETLYRARTSAGKLVRQHPAASYFEIEDAVPYEEAADIWVVVGFFQRLDFLVRHENIQTEMVRELFGELFVWWWVVSFSTQLERCDCDSREQIFRLKDWFYSITSEQQRMPWLERANRDLKIARENADLPLLVVI